MGRNAMPTSGVTKVKGRDGKDSPGREKAAHVG